MLGDFQYCSSSSEDSNSGSDSDSSSKSEESLEKLVAEKRKIEESIVAHQKKLKTIHGTLKSLNEERNKLLLLRNKLISSSCFNDENPTNDESLVTIDGTSRKLTLDSMDLHGSQLPSNSLSSQTSNAQPLNLEVSSFSKNNDEEEFDSD
ncbi:hypothetical protein V9T40_009989 [Parthenolecanium corni]|uniref:Uncharacterized protein n=1 Tax=Parthenolecanium corni TaxID=536013 RepID=A0AAN9TLG8_9HEMI